MVAGILALEFGPDFSAEAAGQTRNFYSVRRRTASPLR